MLARDGGREGPDVDRQIRAFAELLSGREIPACSSAARLIAAGPVQKA